MKSERLKGFALGFAAFAATETSWLVFRSLYGATSRWVLEPNRGIAAALLVHFVAALFFSFTLRLPVRGIYLLFAAGVLTGIVVMLLLVGPGNLWPIVLVIDCVFLAPVLAGGFAVGAFLRRWRPAAA